VIVHGAEGRVDALNLEDGRALWQRDLAADFESPSGFFGRACSPLIVGERVILTPGGQAQGRPVGVVALEAGTGATLWQGVEDEAGYASPVALPGGEILCWMRNGLWRVALEDGAVRASRDLRSAMDASVNAAQPVLWGDDRVLVTAAYGVGLHALQLKTLIEDWEEEGLMDCHYSTPVRKGDLLFGFHGRQETGQVLRCVNLPTRQVVWESERVPGGTVLVAGEDVVVVTEQGELWVVPVAAESFTPRLRVQILRSGHRSYPAYADGVLYARDDRRVVAVRLR
ncbi:MAG: PQQ-binding-like beta-propeller repeat protein, partial [Verrucomicrobiales bacterium]|nr:PQQ-binding-like beta-propeller repeat protein [Verrucomicrobiales bacterium]